MKFIVKEYSWIYNKYNANMNILFTIIVLLLLIILNFNYLNQKRDYNPNIKRSTILSKIIDEL